MVGMTKPVAFGGCAYGALALPVASSSFSQQGVRDEVRRVRSQASRGTTLSVGYWPPSDSSCHFSDAALTSVELKFISGASIGNPA